MNRKRVFWVFLFPSTGGRKSWKTPLGQMWSSEEMQAPFNIWSEEQPSVLFGEVDFLFRSWLIDEPGFLLPGQRSFQPLPPPMSSCCACLLPPPRLSWCESALSETATLTWRLALVVRCGCTCSPSKSLTADKTEALASAKSLF